MRQLCQCQWPHIRLSRFRLSDLPRLFTLVYPVRCRKCYTRGYTDLLHAIRIRRQP